MPTAAPTERQLAAQVTLRHVIEFGAEVHAIEIDGRELDAAVRRVGSRSDDLETALRRLGAEMGLTMAVVRRPLRDVLAEAAPEFPWLALRPEQAGTPAAIAVLGGRARTVRVVTIGAQTHTARWSVGALMTWLGVEDADQPTDWVLAEPSAPLARMRSSGAPLSPLARLNALLVGERRTLWVAAIYSVVIAVLSLIVPVAVQSLVNTIAFGAVLQPLVVLTLFVFVALGFSTALNALRAGVVEIVQRSIFARVATDVTWRLLRVRADAFDRYHGPELVNRFFDTVTVQKSAALLLIDGLNILMQTLIGMVLLAVYHPWLLVFDVLIVAVMLFIVFVLGRGAIATSINESKAKYALEAWLEQLAAHLITFKSDGGARHAVRMSQRLLEDYLSYRRKHFRILIRQVIGSFSLQAVASAALLGIGGWLVIDRQLSLGQLVASELVVAGMLSAFTKFGKQLEVFYDLCAAIDKLGALVDLPLERGDGDATLPSRGPARLSMRGLQLCYPDSSQPTLNIRSWDVAAGERVGVTGPNGSGKSTLADVLFGLRTPTGGSLRVDDIDIRSLSLGDLRRHAVLVRDVELFPGTVLDNLRMGRDEISHDDARRALEAVGLLDELLALPQGLNTALHPHGRPLSYQQACRLMVARAIVDQPRLLVLDGVLDRIDHRQEDDRLTATLFAGDAPWTLVCITQRPDVLARCSHVVRVEAGDIEPVQGLAA